ncbi:MAG: bifunctional riboflavin kinase/FAD synthetase [Rhizobiaceae bacterium]|nr:bifunctional riboflavin kinase/FAD synthetase [Rhizobiaceae bacterium]
MERTFIRHQGTSAVPPQLRNAVVAVGNFDGVHRGHQAVLGHALETGRSLGVQVVALTFEPHPRSIFQPDSRLFRLTPAPMRARILEALGLEGVIEIAFTSDFAKTEALDFVRTVLVNDLAASHVVTGHNFHFGRGRGGNPEFLRKAGRDLGFGVSTIEPFSDEGGAVVSSTRIREMLAAGDAAAAAGLLGYRYTVTAEVTSGRQLGRTLGFPTANMSLPDSSDLRHGIYAVRFRRADGKVHDGVASFGRRPTVEKDGTVLLETFLFDFEGDLYGAQCEVSFFSFLRPELKFDGLDPLVAQMRTDADEARALLAGVKPLSQLDARLGFPTS